MGGLQSSSDGFLRSEYSVRQSAVKNIIFKVASYAAAYIISQSFNIVAYQRHDYTTFLMFQEALSQQFHFIRSRFRKSAGQPSQIILLLTFLFFTVAVGLFDTLLWGLDIPGYVSIPRVAQASSLRSKLVQTPSYLITLSSNATLLDRMALTQALSANLYDASVNVTLDGALRLGTTEPLTATAQISAAHPRILLDNEGFAVSVDSPFNFMLTPNDPPTSCSPGPEEIDPATGFRVRGWNCDIDNVAVRLLLNNIATGSPRVWWGENFETPGYITPIRGDNPWYSLGQGMGTAAMKQVFTVTKGLRRHTFLQTTFKASMIATPPSTFADADIVDMLNRGWAARGDDGKIVAGQGGTMDAIANRLIAAQRRKASASVGNYLVNPAGTSVLSFNTDYLNMVNSETDNSAASVMTTLRFGYTNITLIRSETLSESLAPKPNVNLPCNNPFINVAVGGRFQELRCGAYTDGSAATGRRYQGQIDTSAVLLMTNFLGGLSSGTSAQGMDEDGLQLMTQSAPLIDHYLTARGLILGGADELVTVTTNKPEPAVSKLQIVLSIVPVVISMILLGLTVISKQKKGYYLISFFSAVVNTVHADTAVPSGKAEESVNQCHSPTHIAGVPEVSLEDVDGHVYVAVGGEVLRRGKPSGSFLESKDDELHIPSRGPYLA